MVVFAGVSLLISNAGLDRILQFSVPVLNAIYPVAIVLIALAFLNPLIKGWKRVYPCAILFTALPAYSMRWRSAASWIRFCRGCWAACSGTR